MTLNDKYENQSINRLDIKDTIIKILENNKISTLGRLCRKSKTDLKKLDLTQNQVDTIEIQLQLMGLNLKNSL